MAPDRGTDRWKDGITDEWTDIKKTIFPRFRRGIITIIALKVEESDNAIIHSNEKLCIIQRTKQKAQKDVQSCFVGLLLWSDNYVLYTSNYLRLM